MVHIISGLVVRTEDLDALPEPLAGQPTGKALKRGFSFLPIDYENLDDIVGPDPGPPLHGFRYLSQTLIDLLSKGSIDREFIYIETGYCGPVAGQGAVAFRSGAILFGPEYGGPASRPINAALSAMGVSGEGATDAFEAVGLPMIRENWRAGIGS